MIRMFLEPEGPRLSEIVGLTVAALNLDEDEVTVMGKGRRSRVIPFGSKTGQALERYVRDRARHRHRADEALWVGMRGPVTTSGVQQMMRRRSSLAGLPHTCCGTRPPMSGCRPGVRRGDALRLFGWRSREMLGRYGASAADARAQAAARDLGLGNRY